MRRTFSTTELNRDENENTPAGTNIGARITATDTDSGDTLKYSLVDPNPNTDRR